MSQSVDMVKFNSMLAKWIVLHQDKKRLIVTVHGNPPAEDLTTLKTICETFGWNNVVINVDNRPCGGFSFMTEYLNLEDKPKQEPGHVYA